MRLCFSNIVVLVHVCMQVLKESELRVGLGRGNLNSGGRGQRVNLEG